MLGGGGGGGVGVACALGASWDCSTGTNFSQLKRQRCWGDPGDGYHFCCCIGLGAVEDRRLRRRNSKCRGCNRDVAISILWTTFFC